MVCTLCLSRSVRKWKSYARGTESMSSLNLPLGTWGLRGRRSASVPRYFAQHRWAEFMHLGPLARPRRPHVPDEQRARERTVNLDRHNICHAGTFSRLEERLMSE